GQIFSDGSYLSPIIDLGNIVQSTNFSYSQKIKKDGKELSWGAINSNECFEQYLNVGYNYGSPLGFDTKNSISPTCINDCPAINSQGVYGQSAYFSGKGETFLYQNQKNNFCQNQGVVDVGSDFVVEAWIKPSSSGSYQTIVSENGVFYLSLNNLRPAFYANGLNKPGWHLSNSSIPLGEWTSLAVKYDGKSLKFFVNGVLDKTVSNLSGSIGINGGVYIGNRQENIAAYRFNGHIDSVLINVGKYDDAKIYNSFLSGLANSNFDYRICDASDCGQIDFDQYVGLYSRDRAGRYFQYRVRMNSAVKGASLTLIDSTLQFEIPILERGAVFGETTISYIDSDNSQTGFGGGVKSGVDWDNNGFMTLDDSGKNSGKGEFVSRVFGSNNFVDWTKFSWSPIAPYGSSLPNDNQKETGYEQGNLDMSGNVLLYHFDYMMDYIDIFYHFMDSSGKGNDIISSTVKYELARNDVDVSGYSAKFDGIKDYLNAGMGDSLNLSQAVTFETWVKPESSGVYKTILARDGSYYFALNNLHPAVYLQGTNKSWMISGASVNLNEWSHLAFVYSGSQANIYINGVLVSTFTGITGSINSIVGKEVWLGSRPDLKNYNFKGYLDEVAVYNRVLLASEIKARYERGITMVKFLYRSCNLLDCSDSNFGFSFGMPNHYIYDSDKNMVPQTHIDGVVGEAIVGAPGRYFQYKMIIESKEPILAPKVRQVKIESGKSIY
ncbi:MAG: LamG domain-containing protein, partial [bacterium]|nr:LamG domain-containing protein [bacterium]